jgi:aminoglycoside 3-N-acetyltransferase I
MNEMHYTFRRLDPPDVEAMRTLNSVFAETFDDRDTYLEAPPSDEYLASLLSRQDFIALVALCGDTVIGGLVAYSLRKFEQERSEIYIYDLAVSTAHRRQGVATGLIDALKRIARERGAYVIYVQADKGDAEAIALYKKTGGHQEAVFHFDIDPKRGRN